MAASLSKLVLAHGKHGSSAAIGVGLMRRSCGILAALPAVGEHSQLYVDALVQLGSSLAAAGDAAEAKQTHEHALAITRVRHWDLAAQGGRGSVCRAGGGSQGAQHVSNARLAFAVRLRVYTPARLVP